MARLRSGEIRLDDEQKQAVHDLYRGEVAAVDAAVGTVLDALDRHQLRDTTLVVCVADHGEEFWDHGGVEHGHTVYEELIRVPLMMRWPVHLPSGRRVEPIVRLTDVAPTVLALLGVPVPGGRDSESFLPLVRGEAEAPRGALIENMLFADERVGLRTEQYKYVRWDYGKEELYDLWTDPLERLDLAASGERLAVLRATYAAFGAEPNERPRTGSPPIVDERTEAAMRALGYLK